jgi:hypothetical protein
MTTDTTQSTPPDQTTPLPEPEGFDRDAALTRAANIIKNGKGGRVEALRDLQKQHPELPAEAVEQIIEEVDRALAEILDDVVAYLRRFVVLSEDQYVAVALWVAATHVMEAAEVAPLLHIRSPEKGSGKSVLLDVLEKIVAAPWPVSATSTSAFFRKIDCDHPTVLFDEIDQVFAGKTEDHADLTSAINSGIYRDHPVCRTERVKGGFKLVDFDVFGPKAIAGIGTQVPETIIDRSIPIIMKRKTAEEKVEKLRRRREGRYGAQGPTLQRDLTTWSAQNTKALTQLIEDDPPLPDTLSARAQDLIEILCAVADSAGGDWGERARGALERIILDGAQTEGEYPLPKRALADCRTVFAAKGNPDKLTSAELVAAMRRLDDGPWGEKQDGKVPLNPGKLAFYLRNYSIKPGTKRFGDYTAKGYERADFTDAWERFLTGEVEVAEEGGDRLGV